MEIPKERQLHLDAFRALMALAVVHCHTLLNFDSESAGLNYRVADVYINFVVPAFYFISGFFLYKELCKFKKGGKSKYRSLLTDKFRRYIVPSIFFTLVPFFSRGVELLCHFNTAHYFIPSLFLIILCYCGLHRIIINYSRRRRSIVLILYATFTTLLMFAIHDIDLHGYFHWRQALHENLFFICGVLAAINIEYFDRKCKSLSTLLTLSVLYAISYLIVFPFSDEVPVFIYKLSQRILSPIFGTLTFYCFFVYFSDYFTSKTKIGRLAYYLGRRTLALYIMQDLAFFLIFMVVDISGVRYAELYAVGIFVATTISICLMYDLICKLPAVRTHLFGLRSSRYRHYAQMAVKK